MLMANKMRPVKSIHDVIQNMIDFCFREKLMPKFVKAHLFRVSLTLTFTICIQSNFNGSNTSGLWKLVRDRDSSSQWGLIIAPGQEA